MNSGGSPLPAAKIAEMVRRSLIRGDESRAVRLVTEAVSKLLELPDTDAIAEEVVREPGSTGDPRFDALLGTSFAFAMQKRSLEPLDWMLRMPALPVEWVVDGGLDASDQFRDFIRKDTPPVFLMKRVLIRERDLHAL